MRNGFMHVVLALVLGVIAARTDAAATASVGAAEIGNLVYQLDCVSLRIRSCGNRQAYAVLWRLRFGIDASVDADVLAWKDVRETYSVEDMPLLRIAALEARDANDYLARAHALVAEKDHEVLERILRRVRQPFHEWWEDRAEAMLQQRAATIAQMVERDDVTAELARLRRFMDVRSDQPLTIDLVRRVAPTASSSAEVIGAHAIVEISDGSDVVDVLPIAVHEYTHYLFARRSPEAMARLQRRMLDAAQDVDGIGAWNLLNEALATAMGNGRMARLVQRADFDQRMSYVGGLYANRDVDLAAKALLPLVDAAIARGDSLDAPSFAGEYLLALRQVIGSRLQSPAIALQELAVIAEPDLVGDERTLTRAILESLPTNHGLWTDTAACCGSEFHRSWSRHKVRPRLAIVRAGVQVDLCGRNGGESGYTIRLEDGVPCIVLAIGSREELASSIAQLPNLRLDHAPVP